MIEGCDELDVARQQHAVAEYVARHIADSGDGEVARLGVDTHFAKMPLDRFPRTAGGDAHYFVVVTGRPARGKGVAEPEAVLLADCVGKVREGRRALVSGYDQIGIVCVVSLHLGRRNDRLADSVVCHVEEAPQIILVAGNAFSQEGVAIRDRWRSLEHKPAL